MHAYVYGLDVQNENEYDRHAHQKTRDKTGYGDARCLMVQHGYGDRLVFDVHVLDNVSNQLYNGESMQSNSVRPNGVRHHVDHHCVGDGHGLHGASESLPSDHFLSRQDEVLQHGNDHQNVSSYDYDGCAF